MENEKYGECCICHKIGKLSFEHFPPKASGNNKPLKIYNGHQIMNRLLSEKKEPWNYEGLKYQNSQKGLGKYSLCEKCNNTMGKFYVKEYVKFSNTYKSQYNKIKEDGINSVDSYIKKVNPLLIGKQILTMFCSAYPNLTKQHPIVKDLLLNKELTFDCSGKFRIYMYLLKNPVMSWSGVSTMLHDDLTTKMLVEINVFPFGFVLDLDPQKPIPGLLDITNFIKYSSNEYNCKLLLPIKEKYMIFPLNYMSKEEINSVIKKQGVKNDGFQI